MNNVCGKYELPSIVNFIFRFNNRHETECQINNLKYIYFACCRRGRVINVVRYALRPLGALSLTTARDVARTFKGGGGALQILITISRIILVYYCKCCNLIGYSTRYLFLDR